MSKGRRNKLKNDTENLSETLSELRKYFRIAAACAMSQRAKMVIDNYEKAQTFANLDGVKSDKEISKIVNVARRTVTKWVDEFFSHGLAEKKGRSEKALFTLEELDIQPKDLKKAEKRPRKQLVPSATSEEQKRQGD